MITCTKVKQLLNIALLKGETIIKVKQLSKTDEEDLKECGYLVKKTKNNYIISH